jgi:hypothetical protein
VLADQLLEALAVVGSLSGLLLLGILGAIELEVSQEADALHSRASFPPASACWTAARMTSWSSWSAGAGGGLALGIGELLGDTGTAVLATLATELAHVAFAVGQGVDTTPAEPGGGLA